MNAQNPPGETRKACYDLTRLLTHPGHPAHASVRLRQADRLLDLIDAHMRRFPVAPDGPGTPAFNAAGSLVATEAYDRLSELLRSRGGVVADRGALAEARQEWELLRRAVHAGSFPEPWAKG